ncbi:aspartate dehydrogenase [Lachnospiraceae bacterium C1.1]|nr:aspartate dehydrogenase [Lachnospiraceae bacterium C1.1]
MFFWKKIEKKFYDRDSKKPVIKVSICSGEQVAGFQDIHNGSFEDVMLIRDDADLRQFMEQYGILDAIERIY